MVEVDLFSHDCYAALSELAALNAGAKSRTNSSNVRAGWPVSIGTHSDTCLAKFLPKPSESSTYPLEIHSGMPIPVIALNAASPGTFTYVISLPRTRENDAATSLNEIACGPVRM